MESLASRSRAARATRLVPGMKGTLARGAPELRCEGLGWTATAAAAQVGVGQPSVTRLLARVRATGPIPPALVEKNKE